MLTIKEIQDIRESGERLALEAHASVLVNKTRLALSDLKLTQECFVPTIATIESTIVDLKKLRSEYETLL